ncbi:MAG TPA: hypothetical protein VG056_14830 [Pirellulales bacterium]|jgi:hypothetical protein|nr:hypothetical protein [Pirellulales bacterium]
MNENPYESPKAKTSKNRTDRGIKLNAFDKFCIAIAFLVGVAFLFLGAVGLFLGCSAHFSLPPIVGVFPALVGWGIVRATLVALKRSNQSSAMDGGDATLGSGE